MGQPPSSTRCRRGTALEERAVLAGPNPYRLHSFRELRAIMGRPYVICRPCRRFVPIGAWLDRRDTRSTTFSCSVCGSSGDIVLEDPAKEGLQHDPRPKPPRHRLAAIRLQALHQHASHFGRSETPREEARPPEKPYREPMPSFRAVRLPIRTFREAFNFGLRLRIHCPRCHDWRPVDLKTEQLERPFANGVRFVCRHEKLKVYGEGREVCGGLGEPVFEPVAGRAGDRQTVDLDCSGQRWRYHPRWEINGIDLVAAPWAGLLNTSQERFRCPGCGGIARHTFHVPYPGPARTETPPPADGPTF